MALNSTFANITHWQVNCLLTLRIVICISNFPCKNPDISFSFTFPSSHDCCLLDRISESIDQTISLYSTSDIFNAHYVKWLHHSNATDFAGIQTLNFSIAQSLTQILVFFPMCFHSNSDGHTSLLIYFSSLPPPRTHVMLCSSLLLATLTTQ